MNKINQILGGAVLMLFAGSAAAVAISGSINIGGGSQVESDGTNSTGIDFNCGINCGASVNMFPPPTGDFAALGGLSTLGGELTMYNFSYSSIPDLIWDIDYNGLLYSYTLSTIQVLSGDTGNFSSLVLAGSGIMNITNSDGTAAGYDPTPGSWIYSQSGGSFSSQTVPEPGTLALIGIGLIGIGAARKLRKYV